MKTTTLAITLAATFAFGLVACKKAPQHKTAQSPDPATSPMAKIKGPGMRVTPGMVLTHPTAPPPGACAGGLVAPRLGCSVSASAVTCKLTAPCMGTLKLSKPDDARLSTVRGKQLSNLKVDAGGRTLVAAHKQPAGTVLHVDLSWDIRNVAAKTPYSRNHKSQKLAGVKNGRKGPHSYVVSLRVPGAKKTKPVLLVPRKSIGPVKLGMDRAALKKTGLKVRLHPSGHMGNNVLLVGPYYVVLSKGKVSTIEFNLSESAAGVKLGKTVLSPKMLHAAVAKAMPSCGKIEHRLGGSVYTCDGGHLLVKMGGPVVPAAIDVQIFAKPVK